MKNFKPAVFYKQVREELSKVNWPTRDATVRTSVVVLAVVGVITAYLGVVDAIVSRLAAIVIG